MSRGSAVKNEFGPRRELRATFQTRANGTTMTLVLSKTAPLRELVSAIRTSVPFLSRMHPDMNSQILLRIKPFTAHLAAMRLFAGVGPEMRFQRGFSTQRLPAQRAREQADA